MCNADLVDMTQMREMWPEELSEDQVSVLSRRARYLLALAGIGEPPERVPTADELHPLVAFHKGELGRFVVSSMLCHGMIDSIVDSLSPHVLAASLREVKDGSPGVAEKACRKVRLMPQGWYPELLGELQDFSGMETQDVLDWLTEKRESGLRGDRPAEKKKALKKGFDPLVNLLERYVRGRAAPPARKADPPRHTRAVAAVAEADIAPANVHHFHASSDGQRDDGGLDLARGYTDPRPSGSRAHRRSLAIQDYRANAAAAQIVRGYMMSPCRWGVLSEHALARLVIELRAGVENRKRVDALLTASLFTGRPAASLNDLPLREERSDATVPTKSGARKNVEQEALVYRRPHMALRTGLQLPAPGSREYGRYYESAEPIVNLPLPSEVLSCVLLSKPTDVDGNALSKRARELGATASRIESAGHLWLYHGGRDRTLLNRLFGADLAHAAPIYYENMKEERILEAYDVWCRRINSLLGTRPFRIERLPRTSRVGSRRTPKDLVVKNLFRKYRELVDDYLRTPKDMVLGHDHYAVYTYLVLSLATGLRPVRQPFETFKDFCGVTNTCFIQDKDVAGVASPRFVPVAPFAVKQLNHYRAYLSWLPTKLGRHDRRREYVEAALNGQVPYLFTLQGDPREPQPLSPKRVEEILEPISPLNLNWTRHYLRTKLTDRRVHDDVIQAMLGHGDLGQEPFARYSALTMAALKDASDQIEALAGELGIEPLPHPDGNAKEIRQGRKTELWFRYEERRKANAARRRQHRTREVQRGQEWVKRKVTEIEANVEGLKAQDAADDWLEKTLVDLNDERPKKIAWLAARAHLAKELDRLNEQHELAITVPPRPRRPCRTPLMHDQSMFRAGVAVQKAAAKFVEALEDPETILEASDEALLSLTLFSAACFGALAEPEALLALRRVLRSWEVGDKLLNCAPAPVNLCWVECRYESRRASNVVVDGKPLCMRRFFLDGTTLMLLLRYVRRRSAERRSEGTEKPRGRGQTFMDRIRSDVKTLCGAALPKSLKLGQFCKGAVSVAESQPGVRIPHYMTEYAAGLIGSSSLPETYFRAYLGQTYAAPVGLESQRAFERADLQLLDGLPDPEIDRAIRSVRALFVVLPARNPEAVAEVLGRMDTLLSTDPSIATKRLVEWLRHLISERKLVLATARRYSDWIATGWLVQFDGVDLERLTGEEWFQRYEDMIETEDENHRAQVAGRVVDFHQFLHETRRYKPLPGDQQLSYQSMRFVRAQVIPERLFAAFIQRLPKSFPDISEQESVQWLFTLCYRLGTRIGETTRIRRIDIEWSENPVVKLRANRFGNTKTKTPHQLPLNPFLPGEERRGFREWLERRREVVKEDNALIFGWGGTAGSTWDTRELARLFTTNMYKITGLHFSPHSCRHSLASRLIWLAENEDPPEGSVYTPKEIGKLREAAFTAAPDCRDRVWHLSSVFNHHSPSTTFESYVHFLDLLLYKRLARSERRLSPKALGRLLDVPTSRFKRHELCDENGFPVERVLPFVHESNPGLFEVIESVPGLTPAPTVAPMTPPEARQQARHVMAQPILEDLENGQEPEAVAIRFGVETDWVEALRESASKLADVKTIDLFSRLFSKERLKINPYPLSPTRVREEQDRELLRNLIPQLLGECDPERRDLMRQACFHFLRHTTTSGSGLLFHAPDDLRRFLKVFTEMDNEVIARHRWLIFVSRVRTKTEEELISAWRVYEGVRVGFKWTDTSDVQRFPAGIAHLHLLKEGEVEREGAEKDTSKAMKCIMHLLSILMLTDDVMEHGGERVRDWTVGQ